MLKEILAEVCHQWNHETETAIKKFVELPALSIDFDKNWEKNGLLMKAVEQADQWVQSQQIKGLKTSIVKDEGFTPCLLVEIDASEGCSNTESVFLYGHLDKQPENHGWDENKGPWKPVIEDGKLYGRGAADDGYSFYCLMSAVKTLQNLGIPHPRCIGLFETCEESSSVHYEQYLKECEDRLGNIGLVVALDSSCGDYDRLWVTKSLRGMLGGALTVKVLNVGVHSGEASGIVPESFMIVRNLLDRVENPQTGEILVKSFHQKITKDIRKQCEQIAQVLGDEVWRHFPWVGHTQPLQKDAVSCVLNRNWEPAMTITGIDGMPSVENGGNVLRPYTKVKIGIRLPPKVDAKKASVVLEKVLTKKPPFGAEVSYEPVVSSDGWEAKTPSKWLKKAFSCASKGLWNHDFCYLGMGASIPLLNTFSTMWPQAEFFVGGVLGPKSNAHGPNEFLHIDYVQKLTATVAFVMAKMGGTKK